MKVEVDSQMTQFIQHSSDNISLLCRGTEADLTVYTRPVHITGRNCGGHH